MIRRTGGRTFSPVRWPLNCDLKVEEEPAIQSPGGRAFQAEETTNRKARSGKFCRFPEQAGGQWGLGPRARGEAGLRVKGRQGLGKAGGRPGVFCGEAEEPLEGFKQWVIRSDLYLKRPLAEGQNRGRWFRRSLHCRGPGQAGLGGAWSGLVAVGTEKQLDLQSILEVGRIGPADGISQGVSERRVQDGFPERWVESQAVYQGEEACGEGSAWGENQEFCVGHFKMEVLIRDE